MRLSKAYTFMSFILVFLSVFSIMMSVIVSFASSVEAAGKNVPFPARSPTQKMKVIEVRYFPKGETDLVYHPDVLSANLQALISKASTFHGYSDLTATPSVQVEVVGVYNRFGMIANPDNTWQGTYKWILAQDNLCERIRNEQIDQVWLWVDPRDGYGAGGGPGVEYAISSKYFKNGVQYATYANPTLCGDDAPFVMMGFDFSRTADLALHSFGHYLEGLLGNLQTVELFWYRYGGRDGSSLPRSLMCGNVHFPPNGTFDYDYSNSSFVNTTCEDWKADGSGIQTSYNCQRWGCSQGGYLTWWMQNMPNKGNTLTYQIRKLPNWWNFTVRMDAAINDYNKDTTFFMDRTYITNQTKRGR
jgi:hypothetical protein